MSENLINWNDSYSVGNTEMDEQHKKLIELINDLILHSNAAPESKIVNETLYELFKYTRYHFQDEEELMQNLNYPNLEEHKKSHKNFIYKISMFCMEVMDRKATVTEDILKFLTNWIVEHTMLDDQDFKKYT